MLQVMKDLKDQIQFFHHLPQVVVGLVMDKIMVTQLQDKVVLVQVLLVEVLEVEWQVMYLLFLLLKEILVELLALVVLELLEEVVELVEQALLQVEILALVVMVQPHQLVDHL